VHVPLLVQLTNNRALFQERPFEAFLLCQNYPGQAKAQYHYPQGRKTVVSALVKGQEHPRETGLKRKRTMAVFLLTVIIGLLFYSLNQCAEFGFIVRLKCFSVKPVF